MMPLVSGDKVALLLSDYSHVVINTGGAVFVAESFSNSEGFEIPVSSGGKIALLFCDHSPAGGAVFVPESFPEGECCAVPLYSCEKVVLLLSHHSQLVTGGGGAHFVAESLLNDKGFVIPLSRRKSCAALGQFFPVGDRSWKRCVRRGVFP